ncbi:MAG: hypothetical protein N2043_13185 [Ignavibacterium sp.]|nr:hypothetical protein [Ignavibacterium sp.]
MDWWYIFPMPDASSELFNWDASVLNEYWGYIIIGFIVVIIGFYVWFYFFNKPKPDALRKFWVRYIIIGVILVIAALIFLLTNVEKLAGESQPINIWRLLWLIFLLSLDYLEASFIIYLIFMVFASMPFNRTQLRAMRRYPFPFIK